MLIEYAEFKFADLLGDCEPFCPPPTPPPPLQKHPIRGRANLWIKKMRQSEDAKSVVTELTNHRAQQGGSHIWSRQSEQAIFLLFKKKRKSVTYSLFLDWILTKIS